MSKANSDAKQNIRVFVRVRPPLPLETSSRSVLDCTAENEVTLKDNVKGKISGRVTKTFRFNHVFNPQSSQVEVYQHVVEPLLEEVLQGYSCTVFAYGQTGTGKTFTMEGEHSQDNNTSWGSDPNAGIIPRTLSELFDRLRLMDANYAVRISFLELYNEELIDLLSAPDDTTKLRLFEDSTKKGAVIISGLEEVEVCTKADVYKILEKGSLKRQTASTLMNAHSSRSHTVFTATIYIREKAENLEGQDVLRTGKINLVDLAGSENIGRSGAIEKRAREAGNINQSLLTLGRVITALVEQSSHVPYRESKLTRLLQESLGGRTKTSIIATVSPALCNYEETLSTLEYAHRAKNIQNKPEINQRLSKKLHLAEYTEEIERLHRDLEATRQRSGVYLHQSEYDEMLRRLESLAEESNEKVEQIRVLSEEKLKRETLCNELSEKLEVVDAALQEKEAALAAEKSALHELQTKLEKTRWEEREQTHLVARHWETAQKLKTQASELRSVAELSSKKSTLLHDKLQRVRSVAQTNENLGVNMVVQVSQGIESGLELMGSAIEENLDDISGLKTHLHSHLEEQKGHLDALQDSLKSLNEDEERLIDACRTSATEQDEQEATWAVELRDSVNKHMESARALDTWDAEFVRPVLGKERDQMMKLKSGIGDVLLKTGDADSWCQENREALVSATTRMLSTLLEEKLPALKKELDEFENVKANASALTEKHTTFIKKLRAEISTVKRSLEMTQTLSDHWQEAADAERSSIANSVANYSEGAAALKQDMQDFLTQRNDELLLIKEHYTQRITDACSESCHAVNQWDTSDQSGDLASSAQDILESARAAWLAQTDATMRLVEEASNERSKICQILDGRFKELERLPEECANKNSESLDELRSKLSNLVIDIESRTSKYNDKVKTWTSSLEKIVKECNERIHSFANQDFREYEPTGETPQRGNVNYPRDLPSTSPHERILGRFRQRLLQARMAAEDDGVEKAEDDSSPALSAVDTSSEIEEGVKNKENNDSIKESPIKKPGKKPKVRKPLVSQNGANNH